MEKKNKMDKLELQKAIIKFFTKNENPNDDKIHELSDKLQVNTHEFETEIYGLLSSILYYGKYNESIRDEKEVKLSNDEIKVGMKVEMEHTNNKLVAKRIVLDHLAEFPDYYTRLAKMEDEAKSVSEGKLDTKQIIQDVFGKE